MRELLAKIIKEDNFLSLAGNVVIAVLGFSGFALLARELDTDAFAQWVLFISGGSLVEMLRFGITNNALVRFLSGATNKTREQLIGSNALISFMATLTLVIILVTVRYVFKTSLDDSGYALFFKWYPILAFVNLPWNNALVVLQAKMEYGNMFRVKVMNSGLFFSILVINSLWFQASIEVLIIGLLMVNFATSMYVVLKNWDELIFVLKATKETITTLLNFGKYSTFTLIGTNLLRNADILILSISPLGNEAVAVLSIPLKLTELQQIPLRSFTATAFPKMSKASLLGKKEEVKQLFYTYSGVLTYLFFFISAVTFVFAEEFVLLISGNQHLNSLNNKFDIVMLVRILAVYGVLLPIDRMTGIGLDSINKPKINTIKVIVMLTTNVVGDLIAVFVFQSLPLVAVSTILFTGVGIVLGAYFLDKELSMSYRNIFKNANQFYRSLWSQTTEMTKKMNVLKS